MNKKLLSVCIVIVFLLVSCQKDVEVVKMATGSIGGGYFPIGNSIAETLSDSFEDITFNAYSSQASLSNSAMLKDGSIDLAIIQSNVSNWAYEGIGFFKDGKVENMRGLVSLYPEMIQIIVTEDSGIQSIDDFSGKRISLGPKESGNYFDAINILEAYGLSIKDIEVKYLTFEESVDAINNNEIDGVFITSGVPTASVVLINSTIKIKLLEIDNRVQNYLVDKYPYYTKAIINKDTYVNLEEDLHTISTPALLVCSDELDDDLVYRITKEFWENIEEIKRSHPSLSYIKFKDYNRGMSIPMHPGALKYYEEEKVKNQNIVE